MTPKILAKAGDSLADVYDVVGSIAGIETLESEEVQLVHELGATIFSERFSQTIRRGETGDINQSTAFNVVINDMPATPARIHGISVIADTDRISFCQVSLVDPISGREFPIWVWDTALDDSVNIQWVDDGGAAANDFYLRPTTVQGSIPSMVTGISNRQGAQRVRDVHLRGQSTAFGAGTVNAVLQVFIGLASVGGGVNSRGLPLPSW